MYACMYVCVCIYIYIYIYKYPCPRPKQFCGRPAVPISYNSMFYKLSRICNVI